MIRLGNRFGLELFFKINSRRGYWLGSLSDIWIGRLTLSAMSLWLIRPLVRELAEGLVLHEIVIKWILEGPAPACGGNRVEGDLRLKAEDVLRVRKCSRCRADFWLLLLSKSFEGEIAAAFLAGGSAAYIRSVLVLRPPPLRSLLPLALRLRGNCLLGGKRGMLGLLVFVGGFLEPETLLSPYLLMIRMLLFKMNLAWFKHIISLARPWKQPASLQASMPLGPWESLPCLLELPSPGHLVTLHHSLVLRRR